MSIPSNTLQKLALEIESQAFLAQQQLGSIRTQIAVKNREQRLARLTLSEVELLPQDAILYKAIGKMHVNPITLIPARPFTVASCPNIKHELKSQLNELKVDLRQLNQRLQYFEKTYNNCQEHINKMQT
ncbi:hypothetical protein L249_5627 [Ophiocordyceps polyrhachis-furcata BCC 54312]|uniref:Prefoldin subunit 1 n=1 Tax=Ophiocordyceps polyrhachis-furcata BCC 54312 TaxID=1330021 RepID=A0A367LGQ0_9HYPO|nr:hypothetical protein L249_5627 [Ophiocordyceps polyrhachis-furcata BCC 54312]